jgi:hypothetical protein
MLKQKTRNLLIFSSLVITIPVFAVLNYLWSWFTDFLIAYTLGGYRTYPDGRWTEIGNISWTLSSLLGVSMSVTTPAMGIILMPMLAGLALSLLMLNFITEVEKPFGRRHWLAWSVALLWLLKIPVPLEYSLFYWTAVRY